MAVDFPELASIMTTLPKKESFGIQRVAEFTGVSQGTLRYWEEQFSCLRPIRSRAGQRFYRRGDIRTILRIKHLLHEQRFTIAGARRQLVDQNKAA